MEALFDRISSLRISLTSLAETLDDLSLHLREGRLDGMVKAIDRLQEAQREFDAVCAKAAAEYPNLALRLEGIHDLGELETLLSAVQHVRTQAGNILYRAIGLRAEQPVPGLDAVHRQATALLDKLNTLTGEVLDVLVDRRHPLTQLLALVEQADELREEQLEAFEDAVDEAFGRPLRRAANRGLLYVHSGELPDNVTEDSDEDDTSLEEVEASLQDVSQKAPVQTESMSPLVETAEAEADDAPQTETVSTAEDEASMADSSMEQAEFMAAHPGDEIVDELRIENVPGEIEVTKEEKAPGDFPTTQEKISYVARGLLEGDLDRREQIGGLIWDLLDTGDVGTAYYLSLAGRAQGWVGQDIPGPALIRALALGPSIQSNLGLLAQDLQDLFAALDDHLREGDNDELVALRLLCVAAAIRPALLAPHTNAPYVLGQITFASFPVLKMLVDEVAAFSVKMQPLHLPDEHGHQRWEEEVETLRTEASQYLEAAPHRTVKYWAATRVWQIWVHENGWIYGILQNIADHATSKAQHVQTVLHRLDTTDAIGNEIDRTVRDQMGLTTYIQAGARERLIRWAQEACEFGRRWLTLLEHRPEEVEDWVVTQSDRITRTVLEHWDSAMKELEVERGEAHCLSYAKERVGEVLASVHTLLTQKGQDTTPEIAPSTVIYRPLLRTIGLSIDVKGVLQEPLEQPEVALRVLNQLLTLIAYNPGWNEALEAQLSHKDFTSARRLVDWVELHPDDADETNPGILRARFREELDGVQKELERRCEELEGSVEETFALQLLTEEEWGHRRGELARYKEILIELDDTEELELLRMGLNDLWRFVDKRRRLGEEKVRERMDALFEEALERIQPPGYKGKEPYATVVRQRIEDVLVDGNLVVAHEYIDLVLHERPLPAEETGRTAFDAFFPTAQQQLVSYAEGYGNEFRKLAEALDTSTKSRSRVALADTGIDLVRGMQANQALGWVQIWEQVKRDQSITREQASALLEGLGFTIQDAEVIRSRGKVYIEVRTDVVARREDCPIPAFGSMAEGRYRVLCYWDRPTEEEIIRDVQAYRSTEPRAMLVFFFGRLTEQRRRALARKVLDSHVTLAVLDDLLLMYLCTREQPRLRAFFECAAPFSYAEPFTDQAGWVPPEMFYGRRNDIRDLVDRFGACLVYGGRQLGKTALLRVVERQVNAEAGGTARYLDLRPYAFNTKETPVYLWTVLMQEFRHLGVIPDDLRAHKYDRIQPYVEKWLDETSGRRMVLLLDEADEFINADQRNNFQVCNQLKALMDRTERRFKVVFAGLHNVLRSTRNSNHPLAHFGTPICVGPLLGESEALEGRALIQVPLEAMGYRFESGEVLTRIRSATNSYPSLLQLYGRRLLKHMNQVRQLGDGPPWTITRRDVDTVYRSQELLGEIRQKFELTLDLDPRYALITFVIADACHIDGHQGLSTGYTVEWIQQQALDYYREGFRGNSSYDDFVALLKELTGLGVLRSVRAPKDSQERYTLRSPNLLSLLGTRAALEQRILSFQQREKEPPYSPDTFRPVVEKLMGSRSIEFRSPLTAEHLNLLTRAVHTVAVILGCRASGIEDVHPNLEKVPGVRLHYLTEESGVDNFKSKLDEVRRQQKTDKEVVYVSRACPWDPRWVAAAQEWVSKRRSGAQTMTIVFEAGAENVWALVEEEAYAELRKLEQQDVLLLSLQPWHLDTLIRWLKDLVGSIPIREAVTRQTGNWPFLLMQMIVNGFIDVLKGDASTSESLLEMDGLADAFLETTGVAHPLRRRVLLEMAKHPNLREGVSAEDLRLLLDNEAAAQVDQVLRWTDQLSLTRPTRRGHRVMDELLFEALLLAPEPVQADPAGG